MSRATRRSSGGGEEAPLAPVINVHPSQVTIDARCISMNVLRECMANGNRKFEGPIDFVDMSLEDIGSLFVPNYHAVDGTARANFHELPPPLSHRRTATDIRRFLRRGNNQKIQLIDSQSNIQIERSGMNYALIWNGEFWDEVPILSMHPCHPATINVNSIPIDELRENLPKENQNYEGMIDFLDAPDTMIEELFLTDNTTRQTRSRANEEIFPPGPFRRVASQIRSWFELSNNQREKLIKASPTSTLKKSPHHVLFWNGTSWVMRGSDGVEANNENYPQPTVLSGCPGITKLYLETVPSVAQERKDEKVEGFIQTCREGMSERVERSRPSENNNWPYCPPIVGVIPNGNDKNDIRWTVEEQPHKHGEDQYDYLSIHAMACHRERFVGGEDGPTAICEGCKKMKKMLDKRFDSNKKLHDAEINPNTRNDLLKRTGSLQDKKTQYHKRESQNTRKRLKRLEKKIKILIEETGVNVKINKASDAIFDDEDNISAVEEFLNSKLSQDSIASYAFRGES